MAKIVVVIYDPNSALSSTTVWVTVGSSASVSYCSSYSNVDGLVASGGKFSSTWGCQWIDIHIARPKRTSTSDGQVDDTMGR